MKRRVSLRKRLRTYAETNGFVIKIEPFIREQMDFADIGIAAEVDLNSVWQTLSRFPEFTREGQGVYRYNPTVFEALERKRLAVYESRRGKACIRKSQEEKDLAEIFG